MRTAKLALVESQVPGMNHCWGHTPISYSKHFLLCCKYTNPLVQLTKHPVMWFHKCEGERGKPQGYHHAQVLNYTESWTEIAWRNWVGASSMRKSMNWRFFKCLWSPQEPPENFGEFPNPLPLGKTGQAMWNYITNRCYQVRCYVTFTHKN